jgi:hypothetical protein
MTNRTKLTSGIALLGVVAAALISWAASSGASSGLTEPQNNSNPVSKAVEARQHPATPTASISEDQAQFSALDSPGTAFPSSFAETVGSGPTASEYGLNLSLARPVGAAGNAWLIPGNGELCLWLTNTGGKSGGSVCSTTVRALAGELSESRMNEAGEQHVLGVVPDDISSVTLGGQSLKVENNGWEATTGQGTTTATITAPNGAKTVEVP